MGLLLLILVIVLLFGGGGYYGYRSGYYGGAHYGGGLGLVAADRGPAAAVRRISAHLLLADRGGGGYLLPPWPAEHCATPHALAAAGLIPHDAVAGVARVERRYAVAIPPAMQALIERPDDPIGRQFIPDPGRTGHRAA